MRDRNAANTFRKWIETGRGFRLVRSNEVTSYSFVKVSLIRGPIANATHGETYHWRMTARLVSVVCSQLIHNANMWLASLYHGK